MAQSDLEFLFFNKSYQVHFFYIEIWNELYEICLNSNKFG